MLEVNASADLPKTCFALEVGTYVCLSEAMRYLCKLFRLYLGTYLLPTYEVIAKCTIIHITHTHLLRM